MNQDGMPMRFQLHDKLTNKVHKVVDFWGYYEDDIVDKKYLIPSQAIGAFSSDDPPQELYFGDLIEVAPIKDITKYSMIGELVWHKLGVYLRCWNTFERDFEYWSFHSFIKSKTPLKKLGSRYTEEGKKILRKAGLEEKDET